MIVYNKMDLPYILHPINKHIINGFRIMVVEPFIGHYDIYSTHEIANIWISPEYRNLGYLNILMKNALENNENLWLWVDINNTIAITCYKKHNFIYCKNTIDKKYRRMKYNK